MTKLLPPLASDISGCISICKNTKLLPLVYTPGGCDAPHRKLNEINQDFKYLKTKFDDLDFNMGPDEKLIASINNLDDDREILLLPTPMTEMIGCDYSSIIARSNKSIYILKTNGFNTYKQAINLFFKSNGLLKSQEPIKNKIQIVGFSDLAYGDIGLLEPLAEILKRLGYDLELLGQNDLIKNGEYSLILNPESDGDFPGPIYGYPIGNYGVHNILKSLGLDLEYETSNLNPREKVTIIGEYSTSISLAKCLSYDFGYKNIKILSFSSEIRSAKNNDNFKTHISIEAIEKSDLKSTIEASDIVISDPLFKKIYKIDGKIFIPLPYIGLSGRYFSSIKYDLVGQAGLDYIKQFI